MRLGLAVVLTGAVLAGAACGQEGASEDRFAPTGGIQRSAVASDATNDVVAGELAPSSVPATPTEGSRAATAPPLTERQPGCLDTVGSLPEPADVAVVVDPVKAALDGSLVPLPLPGHDRHRVVSQTTFRSADEYLDTFPGIVAPEERRAVMEAAGFTVGVDTTFAHDEDRYSVTALRFASAEGAREYYGVHLLRACRDAVGMQPLEHPAGAVRYTREINGDQYPKAVALVGDVEISVSVCRCVGVTDLEGLSAAWIGSIAEQIESSGDRL